MPVPPHDIQAEMAVLGSLLLGNATAVAEGLTLITDADFYRDAHAHIFRAMRDLAGRGEPVDVVTLKNALTQAGTLEQIGGLGYLMQLGDVEFTTVNLPTYARIVTEKASLRRLIETCSGLIAAAFTQSEEASVLLEEAERRVLSLDRKGGVSTLSTTREMLRDSLDRAEEAEQYRGQISGLESGFPALDDLTCGFQPSDLIYLAARPSVGKSALAGAFFSHALKMGARPLFFSLEMSRKQVSDRLLCAEGSVDGHKLKAGTLSRDEWGRLVDAQSRLYDFEGFVDTEGSITPAHVRSVCRRVQQQGGLDLVIVDYIGLMKGGGKYQNKNAELEEISASLKTLAKEFDVPVIVLSQLSREVEKREDKRPLASDLRDSGALEQDADQILMLYRANYYASPEDQPSRGDTTPDEVEVLVRKNRNGQTGMARLGYIRPYTKFVNVTQEPFERIRA